VLGRVNGHQEITNLNYLIDLKKVSALISLLNRSQLRSSRLDLVRVKF
jgi:hypothetical protein